MSGVGCVFLIPAPLLLWMLISPRSMWRVMSAWAYKHPEAHEPSEAGYAVNRVAAAIGLVALLLIAINVGRSAAETESHQQRERYQACLPDERAEDDGGLLSPEDRCENLSPAPRVR